MAGVCRRIVVVVVVAVAVAVAGCRMDVASGCMFGQVGYCRRIVGLEGGGLVRLLLGELEKRLRRRGDGLRSFRVWRS